MAGRIVLVTGSTGGIGLATATALARMGARVAVNGRDQARTEEAANEVAVATGVMSTDSAPICPFRPRFAAWPSGLARSTAGWMCWSTMSGGVWATRKLTVDGIEKTLAINHLAPFLLTNLLADALRAAPAARVITVSSGAQAMGRINLGDLGGEDD